MGSLLASARAQSSSRGQRSSHYKTHPRPDQRGRGEVGLMESRFTMRAKNQHPSPAVSALTTATLLTLESPTPAVDWQLHFSPPYDVGQSTCEYLRKCLRGGDSISLVFRGREPWLRVPTAYLPVAQHCVACGAVCLNGQRWCSDQCFRYEDGGR
jgi:hypothetical protein